MLSFKPADPLPVALAHRSFSGLMLVVLLFTSWAASAVDKVTVQGLFNNKAMIMVDGKRHVIGVGESTPDGVRLLSANSNEAVLEVAGERSVHVLGDETVSTSFVQSPVREERIFRDSYGMYMTFGSINGRSARLLVDTGATAMAMNMDQARELGIDYKLIGSPTTVTTASGYARAYSVNLKKVSVGSISLSNVEAIIIEGSHPGPILLGMSFLGRLGVEQTHSVMTLRQN